MKVLSKAEIYKNNITRYAVTEKNVMSRINHPFIVGLNYAFQTNDLLYLILDYCPGGNIGDLLDKVNNLEEDTAKLYTCEIILALEELHKNDIIYRDLKPDNVVIDGDGHVRLTDFGLSKENVQDDTLAMSFCGSTAYLAPEMIKRSGHGKAVDWYLLGILVYEMLTGIPPFYSNDKKKMMKNIIKQPLKLPAFVSKKARSILKMLLAKEPEKRLGAGKYDARIVKSHPWFEDIDWDKVYKRQLPVPTNFTGEKLNDSQNIISSRLLRGQDDNHQNEENNYIQGWSFHKNIADDEI